MRPAVPWIVGLLFVPLLMGGAVVVSATSEEARALKEFHPLAPGTTWVYDTTTDGKDTGRHWRQVSGRVNLPVGGGEGFSIRSYFENYIGFERPYSNVTYYGTRGDTLLQFGSRGNGEFQTYDKPLELYSAPFDEPHATTYDGLLGTQEVHYELELVGVEDVTAGGRDYEDCAHYRSYFEIVDGEEVRSEDVEEWTCPGIGPVKIVDDIKDVGVLEEELVAFSTPGRSFGDIAVEPGEPETEPEGDLGAGPVWTDTRNQNPTSAPVGGDGRFITAEEDGRVSATDVETGEVLWSVGLDPPLVTQPAVSGSVVLVADASKTLFALDVQTGWTMWARSFDDVVSTRPVVHGGRVFVVTDDRSVQGIEVVDGSIAWSQRLFAVTRQPPVIVQDLLILADDEGGLTAFDPTSGDEVWSQEMEDITYAAPAGTDGIVVASDNTGGVYAFDPATGEPLWLNVLSERTESIDVSGEDVVVLTDSDQLNLLSIDGERRWSVDLDSTDTPPKIVGEEIIVVSERGVLRRFDIDSGSEGEAIELPVPGSARGLDVDLPMSVIDDTLVISGELDQPGLHETLYAYPIGRDASGVALDLGRRNIPFNPMAPPAIASDGTLYMAGADRKLYAVAPDGTSTEIAESEEVISFVALSGDTAIAQLGDRLVGSRDGEQVWEVEAGSAYLGASGAAGGSAFYLPELNEGLAAIDPADGGLIWRHSSLGVLAATPAVVDDGVIYASGGLYRLDERGEEVWSAPAFESFTPIVLDGGRGYFGGGLPTGNLGIFSFDVESGAVLWEKTPFNLPLLTGVAAGAGVVVAVDNSGLVHALDGATGEELWTHQLADAAGATPAIHEGMVYLTTAARDEDLYQRTYRVSVHDLQTGGYLGSYEPVGPGHGTTPSNLFHDGKLMVPVYGANGAQFETIQAVSP